VLLHEPGKLIADAGIRSDPSAPAEWACSRELASHGVSNELALVGHGVQERRQLGLDLEGNDLLVGTRLSGHDASRVRTIAANGPPVEGPNSRASELALSAPASATRRSLSRIQKEICEGTIRKVMASLNQRPATQLGGLEARRGLPGMYAPASLS
jgi:hypothetical protein